LHVLGTGKEKKFDNKRRRSSGGRRRKAPSALTIQLLIHEREMKTRYQNKVRESKEKVGRLGGTLNDMPSYDYYLLSPFTTVFFILKKEISPAVTVGERRVG